MLAGIRAGPSVLDIFDVRFPPESDRLLRGSEVTLCAMYGRRPRCKGKIGRLSEAFGCSHVFGLWMQPLWLLALM